MTVDELAVLVGGSIADGDGSKHITGPASIADASEGHVTFFSNPKYLPALKRCRATAALVPLDFDEQIPAIRIKVANPSMAFAGVVEKFAPEAIFFPSGIHPSAIIAAGVRIGDGVSVQAHVVIEAGADIGPGSFIGANCYIGHHAAIGENCRIYPNVSIRERTRIGRRVIIHCGAVIGSDGFGFELIDGRHVKIPQIGHVQIDDDVEIGANTTIDRARFGRTWIQEGAKIDNLVQIAHNVEVGRHSIIVSQAGISGSSKLGNYVTLAGQVGLVGHIEVGDRAIIAAQSGVSKNVPAGEVWWGSPAVPMKEQKDRYALISRLGKLSARVKALEQGRHSEAAGLGALSERLKTLEQLLDSKQKSSPKES